MEQHVKNTEPRKREELQVKRGQCNKWSQQEQDFWCSIPYVSLEPEQEGLQAEKYFSNREIPPDIVGIYIFLEGHPQLLPSKVERTHKVLTRLAYEHIEIARFLVHFRRGKVVRANVEVQTLHVSESGLLLHPWRKISPTPYLLASGSTTTSVTYSISSSFLVPPVLCPRICDET